RAWRLLAAMARSPGGRVGDIPPRTVPSEGIAARTIEHDPLVAKIEPNTIGGGPGWGVGLGHGRLCNPPDCTTGEDCRVSGRPGQRAACPGARASGNRGTPRVAPGPPSAGPTHLSGEGAGGVEEAGRGGTTGSPVAAGFGSDPAS